MTEPSIIERIERLEQAIDTNGYISPTVEAVRFELYECLRWFGTLPEAAGDEPTHYPMWDELGEIAQRIVDAITVKEDE